MTQTVGWYMSFADPRLPEGEQFLGVALVPGSSFEHALTRTHLRGYNPGGEIKFVPLAILPPVEWLDCLLSKSDLDELEHIMGVSQVIDNPKDSQCNSSHR